MNYVQAMQPNNNN